VRWNRSLCAVTGYADAQIGSMHPSTSSRDATARRWTRRCARCSRPGEGSTIEAELGRSRGQRAAVRHHRQARAPGRRTYMIGLGADITLKRRTEQQMARAKERLDLALSSSSLALWDWDLRLDRVYFNENWKLILGEAPEETTFSGEEVLGWNHPTIAAGLPRGAHQCAEGRERGIRLRVPGRQCGARVDVDHSRGKVTQRDPAARRCG
jgi:PAS domain S-box-containing protein